MPSTPLKGTLTQFKQNVNKTNKRTIQLQSQAKELHFPQLSGFKAAPPNSIRKREVSDNDQDFLSIYGFLKLFPVVMSIFKQVVHSSSIPNPEKNFEHEE